MDPRKVGFLGRAYDGLFGSSSIVNDPTIDYNQITNYNNSYENTIDSTKGFSKRDSRPSKPFRDLFEHTQGLDDDLKMDLGVVYDQHDHTVLKLEKLPYSFPKKSNSQITEKLQDAQLSLARINSNFESVSSIYDKDKLQVLLDSIDAKNEFLSELNELVDITNSEDLDIDKANQQLYNDYTEELIKCNKFYEAYYKLAFKYGELKGKKEKSDDLETDVLCENISDNLKLIKTLSTKSLVLAKCDLISVSLTKYQNKVQRQWQTLQEDIISLKEKNNQLESRCSYYQDELEKAKLRILELEREGLYRK